MTTFRSRGGSADRHGSWVLRHGVAVLLCLPVWWMSGCAPQEAAKPAPPQPVASLAPGDARTFTKLIEGSISPNGSCAVAVGTADRSAPEWLLVEPDGRSLPSYMVADQFNAANYLVDLSNYRVLATLDSNHSGTAGGYNHESASFLWSLDSRWLVEQHHWKWHTAQCTVHRLAADGTPQGRLDLKTMAHQVLLQQLLRTVSGAQAADLNRYAQTIEVSKITNDGIITARVAAEVPKVDAPYLEATVTAKVSGDGVRGLVVKVISP